MNSILRVLFDNTPIVPGQVFVLDGDGGNPFNNDNVIVKEVRQGWVRYHYVFSGRECSKDSSLSIKDFRLMYERVKEERNGNT